MKSLIEKLWWNELPSWAYHLLEKFRLFAKRSVVKEGNPPLWLSFVYGYDPGFNHVGEEFVKLVVELCALRPDGKVLDIGCGVGRCALPLTGYLTGAGEYQGVDVRKDGVAWCKKNIGSKYPNFHFQHLNIANATYAPLGRGHAATATIPFPDNCFDIIFTKSVFTHMDIDSISRYLKETYRMLKPGGRCLHTFFLLNKDSRRLQTEGGCQFNFQHPAKGGMSVSRMEPEKAIAFEESLIIELYHKAGLSIERPLRYGSWSGRADGLSGQDIVIATKA